MPKVERGTVEDRAKAAQRRSKERWVALQERREQQRFLPRHVTVRVPIHLRARLAVLAEKLVEKGLIRGRKPWPETFVYLLEQLDAERGDD